MIELERVRFRAGSRTLLNDVSVAVRCGTVTALLGPNGAGKSTVLKLASGELTPSSGDVRLDGRSLAGWSLHERAARRAVLPQQSQLSFSFRVRDVVALGRAPHTGVATPARNREAIDEAMERTGVLALAERAYPTLSGGEQQRVQLARVLAQIADPPRGGGSRYLLLDEPTSGLDPAFQHQLLALARRAAADGLGVLVVLHDLNLAAQYADHLVVLAGGAAVANGAPHDVLTSELVHRVFGFKVLVLPHPCLSCPLVVPNPAGVASMTLEPALP